MPVYRHFLWPHLSSKNIAFRPHRHRQSVFRKLETLSLIHGGVLHNFRAAHGMQHNRIPHDFDMPLCLPGTYNPKLGSSPDLSHIEDRIDISRRIDLSQ